MKRYTLSRYRTIYRLHIEPTFGDLPFASIEGEDVEDWIASMMVTHSPKSVHNFHGLLFTIFKHGQLRMKLRPYNPCEITELPQINARHAKQIRFFQQREWTTFRKRLAEDVHPLADTLLATGMRWGEATAGTSR